jgi:endonuclease YncB( thermonuclease family)
MIFPKPSFHRWPIFAVTVTAWLSVAPDGAAAQTGPCRFQSIGSASVTAITDARSLRLADGRAVKLAGIDAAPGARAALENLVLGKEVALAASSDTPDRYGRIAAFAFVNGSETPVQYHLLALGQARLSGPIGNSACTSALLGGETRARDAGIGLWTDPGYAVRAAHDGPAIASQRGRFSVAEGRVVSVRDSGGTIYVNFGRRWSEALTVTILKRNEPTFTAAGIDPRTLDGRIVRIRGYVEVRNGPVIEATRPEQIEVVTRGNRI